MSEAGPKYIPKAEDTLDFDPSVDYTKATPEGGVKGSPEAESANAPEQLGESHSTDLISADKAASQEKASEIISRLKENAETFAPPGSQEHYAKMVKEQEDSERAAKEKYSRKAPLEMEAQRNFGVPYATPYEKIPEAVEKEVKWREELRARLPKKGAIGGAVLGVPIGMITGGTVGGLGFGTAAAVGGLLGGFIVPPLIGYAGFRAYKNYKNKKEQRKKDVLLAKMQALT